MGMNVLFIQKYSVNFSSAVFIQKYSVSSSSSAVFHHPKGYKPTHAKPSYLLLLLQLFPCPYNTLVIVTFNLIFML